MILYFLGKNNEAYKTAIDFIDNNKIVFENIGSINSKHLALFGYHIKYSGPHGYAEYKIIVKGEKDQGTIYLSLEKSVGVWKVKEANLILKEKTILLQKLSN